MSPSPMNTDDLIEALAGRLEPVSTRAAWGWMALWIGAGVAVSAVAMFMRLGLRPDIAAAVSTSMFWTKFLYTLALGGLALWLTERLGRPGAKVGQPVRMLQSVALGFIVLATVRYFSAVAPARHALLMGHSAHLCPWYILALSIPVLAGAIIGMRRLAPTRPTLAGLSAGLAAGGVAAFVYAFSCDESAIPFVALWYTLPVLGSGLIGALVGRFALRW